MTAIAEINRNIHTNSPAFQNNGARIRYNYTNGQLCRKTNLTNLKIVPLPKRDVL